MVAVIILTLLQIYFIGSFILYIHLCKKLLFDKGNITTDWSLMVLSLMVFWPMATVNSQWRKGLLNVIFKF